MLLIYTSRLQAGGRQVVCCLCLTHNQDTTSRELKILKKNSFIPFSLNNYQSAEQHFIQRFYCDCELYFYPTFYVTFILYCT